MPNKIQAANEFHFNDGYEELTHKQTVAMLRAKDNELLFLSKMVVKLEKENKKLERKHDKIKQKLDDCQMLLDDIAKVIGSKK